MILSHVTECVMIHNRQRISHIGSDVIGNITYFCLSNRIVYKFYVIFYGFWLTFGNVTHFCLNNRRVYKFYVLFYGNIVWLTFGNVTYFCLNRKVYKFHVVFYGNVVENVTSLVGPNNGAPGDIEKVILPTTKTNTRNVLLMCQGKFDDMNWTYLWPHVICQY